MVPLALIAEIVTLNLTRALRVGEQLQKNPLWAIYQHAADAVENGQNFVDVLNIKMTKYLRPPHRVVVLSRG